MESEWLRSEIQSVSRAIGGGTGVFLAGPMCVGKTPLAKELQRRLTSSHLVYDEVVDPDYDASKRGITHAHDRALRLGHARASTGS